MTGPLKIGLTGSIGMGKSTTAAMFAARGVPIWDADEAVARLYAKGGAAVAPIGAAFPHVIAQGAVSKQALKRAISQDVGVLASLEQIVHPLVQADRLAFAKSARAPMVLFDIPLLFETGAQKMMDAVVVVSTAPEIQRARVLQRGTMDLAQFETILTRQMPDAEKRARADFVITTDTLEHAAKQVDDVIAALSARIQDA